MGDIAIKGIGAGLGAPGGSLLGEVGEGWIGIMDGDLVPPGLNPCPLAEGVEEETTGVANPAPAPAFVDSAVVVVEMEKEEIATETTIATSARTTMVIGTGTSTGTGIKIATTTETAAHPLPLAEGTRLPPGIVTRRGIATVIAEETTRLLLREEQGTRCLPRGVERGTTGRFRLEEGEEGLVFE